LTYRKARSRATNGAIVVIDRFPLKEIRTMDGVRAGRFHEQISSKLKRLFLRLEAAYYSKIGAPDELVVLRIDPEVAVQRRHDEDPQFVRYRNQEIWSRKDWGPQAIVIDAGKPLEQTLAEIRYEVWGRV
jgi:thymidylate kinase